MPEQKIKLPQDEESHETPIKKKARTGSPSGTQTSALKRKRVAPEEWEEDWDIIRELRRVKDAPVDTVGCDKLADSDAPIDVYRFHVLIAAMLSSQTKDAKTAEAMTKLKAMPGGLTAESVLTQSDASLAELIKSACFHNTKAKNIRKTASILQAKHASLVPSVLSDLLALPGVGPKMATLVLGCAFGNVSEGICVDTHVHRICSLLGWGCLACESCQQPEHTRQALESWLPVELWGELTLCLVGLGQQTQTDRLKLFDRAMGSSMPRKTARFLYKIGYKPPAGKFELWKDALWYGEDGLVLTDAIKEFLEED